MTCERRSRRCWAALPQPDPSADVRVWVDRRFTVHGAGTVVVRSRPLAQGLARLSLDRPLPLRIGDRGLLRDPGRRALWRVDVLDPDPPRLRRRGDAARRAAQLAGADGTRRLPDDRREVVGGEG